MSRSKKLFSAVMFLLSITLISSTCVGAEETNAENKDDLVKLNFPNGISVRAFADYVSERLKLNIIYPADMGNRQVLLSAPASVSEDSLLGFLRAILEMNDMSLVEADTEGWA